MDLLFAKEIEIGFGLVWFTFLIFLIAALVCTVGWSRNVLPQQWQRRFFQIYIFGRVIVELLSMCLNNTFKSMVNQAWKMASDLVTFPAFLWRNQTPHHDEGKVSCRIVITVLPLYVDTWSLVDSDDLVVLACDDDHPPGQLAALNGLLLAPPHILQNDKSPWGLFLFDLSTPWLWYHAKILIVLVTGLADMLRYLCLLLFGRTKIHIAISWIAAIRFSLSVMCWLLLWRYWLHAFCRSTHRICVKWAPHFQRAGYTVDFCEIRKASRLEAIMPVRKYYLRFRRVDRYADEDRVAHF